MIYFIVPFAMIIGIAVATPKVPKLSTPMELAAWSKCDVEKVARYTGQGVYYKLQGNDWGNAELVMSRGWGDCKGKALVNQAALLACGYPLARVVAIRRGVGKGMSRHAIVLFSDSHGKRGYIDNDIVGYAEKGESWGNLIINDKRWRGRWKLEE